MTIQLERTYWNYQTEYDRVNPLHKLINNFLGFSPPAKKTPELTHRSHTLHLGFSNNIQVIGEGQKEGGTISFDRTKGVTVFTRTGPYYRDWIEESSTSLHVIPDNQYHEIKFIMPSFNHEKPNEVVYEVKAT